MIRSSLVTDFDGADNSPGLLLWRLCNKWQATQRETLEQVGLTHVQFVLLASLVYASQAGRPTQKQLALFAQTDTMMTSQVIRKLEQKGLVKRIKSDTDNRKILLEPTSSGVRLANTATRLVESVDKSFFMVEGFDLPTFIQLLQVLTDRSVNSE